MIIKITISIPSTMDKLQFYNGEIKSSERGYLQNYLASESVVGNSDPIVCSRRAIFPHNKNYNFKVHSRRGTIVREVRARCTSVQTGPLNLARGHVIKNAVRTYKFSYFSEENNSTAWDAIWRVRCIFAQDAIKFEMSVRERGLL